jgi:hypothetical protein
VIGIRYNLFPSCFCLLFSPSTSYEIEGDGLLNKPCVCSTNLTNTQALIGMNHNY